MPSIVPDNFGTRHDYEVEAKVTFSLVTEKGSPAESLTAEEDTASLAQAMKDYLASSILADLTDGYTVEVTASRKEA